MEKLGEDSTREVFEPIKTEGQIETHINSQRNDSLLNTSKILINIGSIAMITILGIGFILSLLFFINYNLTVWADIHFLPYPILSIILYILRFLNIPAIIIILIAFALILGREDLNQRKLMFPVLFVFVIYVGLSVINTILPYGILGGQITIGELSGPYGTIRYVFNISTGLLSFVIGALLIATLNLFRNYLNKRADNNKKNTKQLLVGGITLGALLFTNLITIIIAAIVYPIAAIALFYIVYIVGILYSVSYIIAFTSLLLGSRALAPKKFI